jgi:hypothetical protein
VARCLLSTAQEKFRWSRCLVATNRIFFPLGAAKFPLGAMKTHRVVRKKIFIPHDDASRGTEKKFYTIE